MLISTNIRKRNFSEFVIIVSLNYEASYYNDFSSQFIAVILVDKQQECSGSLTLFFNLFFNSDDIQYYISLIYIT